VSRRLARSTGQLLGGVAVVVKQRGIVEVAPIPGLEHEPVPEMRRFSQPVA
jgi:hypothetical protein